MNATQFTKYLKHITKSEHINKNDWKHGLTAFWISYFAHSAICEYDIDPSTARTASVKYFKAHPDLAHDPDFNHGGLVSGNITRMLLDYHLITK